MTEKKNLCPRLLDYVVIVGSRHPSRNNNVAQTPELLRRYPVEDHKDFNLPPDVVFFCQPEGCISVSAKKTALQSSTSFVFTLTEKDSGVERYGMCLNFYRPYERRAPVSDHYKFDRHAPSLSDCSSSLSLPSQEEERPRSPKSPHTQRRKKTASKIRNNTLTSLCIISHHPFFKTFRQCLNVFRETVKACNERSGPKRAGGSKCIYRDTVWSVLTGQSTENMPSLVMREVQEIEKWIFRLLSAPVPVPGKTRVEVEVLPSDIYSPFLFALPERNRFSLVDFPLHLPLELLGVDTCLRVLTCIMLEHKVILQSRDYNALTMSVMAFVSMLYPLEYMFPKIPLLPTCMSSAEQLLLAPTPFIIGIPATFLKYKKNFRLPDDVWLIDLDSNSITKPKNAEDLPSIPEPEATTLKNHLKQALASMSMNPQPIKNLDALAQNPEMWQIRRESMTATSTGFNPLIYGNDIDSVDVATRVAMIRFFNSQNVLGNLSEHTRTLRLYPRPVVAFQMASFCKSRPIQSQFTSKLARTQAVEYFAEWLLRPSNDAFARVQTWTVDPKQIGDKPKWYSQQLQLIAFPLFDEETSTLGAAVRSLREQATSDDVPTDESGSDSEEGAASTSSSYSSLSDFVIDIQNSEINGETPEIYHESQVLTVDESRVFCPPSKLHVPEAPASGPDEDSDSTDGSSSPTYSTNVRPQFPLVDVPPHPDEKTKTASQKCEGEYFRYDSGNLAARGMQQLKSSGKPESPTPQTPTSGSPGRPQRPPPPNLKSRSLSRSDSQKSQKGENLQDKPATLSMQSPKGRTESQSSVFSALSNQLDDVTESASTKLSEIFGNSKPAISTKSPKPYAPLGSKKSLEKSSLAKAVAKRMEPQTMKQTHIENKAVTNNESQQFLKDVVSDVLVGQGVGFFRASKVKKLMEDENYRNLVLGRLKASNERKLTDEDRYVEDVCISKKVFKDMLTLMKIIIGGLEHSFQNNNGLGGMSSAFALLEIIHTHYWEKDNGSNKSESSNPSLTNSPFGSRESLSSMVTDSSHDPVGTVGNANVTTDEQSIVEPNANIVTTNIVITDTAGLERTSGEQGDYLRELVKNKELMRGKKSDLAKLSSMDSEISDASTLVSTSSDFAGDDGRRGIKLGQHSSFRSYVSDTELESTVTGSTSKSRRSLTLLSNAKTPMSGGYRYTDGNLLTFNLPSPENKRTYLFEPTVARERSWLWDKLQFWEDSFLDAVAQERDIIGMDQGIGEMIERYESLKDVERKRVEHDEDKLLTTMLYNMIAFMVMMRVSKNEIKRKVRRLLGKCHIGLQYSAQINKLLDEIHKLNANDIDLKPVGSRMMYKLSFNVHKGQDNNGEMLFMEVCDDCVILRSVNGTIRDRWWYERLVNMTCCSQTKVICFWREKNGKSEATTFYTKKCKELYECIKDAMDKARPKPSDISPKALGGEFPVQDVKTGQGGILKVCKDGINLLLHSSRDIEIPKLGNQ